MKTNYVPSAADSSEGLTATRPLSRQYLLPVEAQLKQLLAPYERAATLGSGLALTGGKRLRPQLCLLAYRHSSGNPVPTPAVYELAAAVELLHLATLVHDDVIDNADCRRSEPSVNITHGNRTAVLLGDFFFGCFLAAAADSSSDILSLFAATIGNMVEGELAQAHHCRNLNLTEADYLDIIERKTATLIAAACEAGVRAAGANRDTINTFRGFGRALGSAFQIQDDILDYIGNPDQLGKPLYKDLKEGVITLPLIHALKHSRHRNELARLLLEPELTPQAIPKIAAEVAAAGGIKYAQQRAARYLKAARQELSRLAPSPAKTELEWLLLTLAQRET